MLAIWLEFCMADQQEAGFCVGSVGLSLWLCFECSFRILHYLGGSVFHFTRGCSGPENAMAAALCCRELRGQLGQHQVSSKCKFHGP